MKKLAITGMLLSGLTALAGITGLVICDGESVEAAQEQRMVRVEHTAYGDILCDNRTGVVYFAYGLKSCRILKRFISTDTRGGNKRGEKEKDKSAQAERWSRVGCMVSAASGGTLRE